MASEIDYRQQPAIAAATAGKGAVSINTTNGGTYGGASGSHHANTPRTNPNGSGALYPADSSDASGSASESDDADRPSSELTSPSITSPPYWTHTHAAAAAQKLQGPRHARSVSVESVLPAGAITLQDNELDGTRDGATGGGSSSGGNGYGYGYGSGSGSAGAGDPYQRDRNRACWAKSVVVTDYVTVNGSATNIGAFVVWNIRVATLSVSVVPA
jgi:hypothetical protein